MSKIEMVNSMAQQMVILVVGKTWMWKDDFKLRQSIVRSMEAPAVGNLLKRDGKTGPAINLLITYTRTGK